MSKRQRKRWRKAIRNFALFMLALALFAVLLGLVGRMDVETEAAEEGLTYEEYIEEYGGK